MRIKGLLASAAGFALLATGAAVPASAETDTVRLAQQFGLLYVPLHVVLDQKLVEKHATAAGLSGLKVKLFKISGGANINKALLADTIDFGSHGVGPALKLWGRTKGRFKIAVSMADMPLKLLSNDPNVKKIEDYLTVKNHKISTPAAKVSIQAVTLQMAAAGIWNEPEKLDHLVVSMKHPTALAAMLSGGQSVKSHFATLPYSYQELQSGKVHKVTTSYEILGGQHSVLVMSASRKFKESNPKTYAAVVAAFAESFAWIDKNPVAAAKTFIRYTRSKMKPETVEALIKDKSELDFSMQPKKTMKYANFLNKIGDIPAAKSWKDYYWENNHGFDGS
ncbi:MAG: ABC transporter substrate-binding protein [Alphaproteobacteria bacterium]|nr:ABC transporter substrate-binding protein [Alphaproteobacteria bacterium]